MEEKILEIIRTGRNFSQMAEDITAHLKEFIEWYHRLAQFQFRFKNIDESYQYWIENVKIMNTKK